MNNLSELNVAFIGLGEIGGPVAGHLAEKVKQIKVFNRTASKTAEFCEKYSYAINSKSLKDVVDGADVVITCVGDDDDLRNVYYADNKGILSFIEKDTVVIDHTTASAGIENNIAIALAEKGCAFFDAPVSGGSVGAKNAALAIMVGGDERSFPVAEEVMKAYGGKITYLGKSGSGQVCKMVNQVCIAGILQGLAEGLRLAEEYGMNTNKIISTISSGAAGSWQMDNRSSYMINRDFPAGFTAKLMAKDVRIALSAAEEKQLDLRMLRHVVEQYAGLIATGRGDEDFTNLIDRV